MFSQLLVHFDSDLPPLLACDASSFLHSALTELHEGHPGVTQMKVLARMYIWWPGITTDIERSVRLCTCSTHQMHQSSPSVTRLYQWSWPTRPWVHLHLVYASPLQEKMILVLIDAHSKSIEAICTPSATSAAVIAELRMLFNKSGLPKTDVIYVLSVQKVSKVVVSSKSKIVVKYHYF